MLLRDGVEGAGLQRGPISAWKQVLHLLAESPWLPRNLVQGRMTVILMTDMNMNNIKLHGDPQRLQRPLNDSGPLKLLHSILSDVTPSQPSATRFSSLIPIQERINER